MELMETLNKVTTKVTIVRTRRKFRIPWMINKFKLNWSSEVVADENREHITMQVE